MSMLSSHRDRLREYAKRYDETDHQLASLLRMSADTIWELRDKLCEMRDEHDRLQEAISEAEHEESVAWDRVRKAESEIAKLQVLLADVWNVYCECNDLGRAMYKSALYGRIRDAGIEV